MLQALEWSLMISGRWHDGLTTRDDLSASTSLGHGTVMMYLGLHSMNAIRCRGVRRAQLTLNSGTGQILLSPL